MNNYRNNFLIHTNFLTLTTVGLFHFCKKVFILMNIYIYIYTDANYANTVRVYKDFRNKTFWRISWIIYSKRYIKKKKNIISCWCIWEPSKYVSWNIWAWPCKISLSSWIRIASSFKKIKVKLDLLTYMNMLLMVEKGIKRRNMSLYLLICKS